MIVCQVWLKVLIGVGQFFASSANPPDGPIEIPGPVALRTVIAEHQPADARATDPNAWDSLIEAIALRARVDREAEDDRGLSESFRTLLANNDSTGFFALFPELRTSDEDFALRQRLGRLLLVRYEKAGLFEKLREMSDRRRAVRPIADKPEQPLESLPLTAALEARQLAWMLSFRMAVADEAGHDGQFLDALRSSLAISRVLAHQPRMYDGVHARAIEHRVLSVLVARLSRHPEPGLLHEFERIAAEQSSAVSPAYAMRAQGLIALDTIGWLFTPDRIPKAKKHLPWYFELKAESLLNRGTYSANRKAVEWLTAKCVALAETAPFEREDVNIITRLVSSPHCVQMACSSMVVGAYFFDETRARREGLRAMIALERYWAVRGEYPEALDGLVPGVLEALPIDPWTGRALRYRRFKSDEDPRGRGYLLYSVGKDGMDHGGVVHERQDRPGGPVVARSETDVVMNEFLPKLLPESRLTPPAKQVDGP